ncbi:MAG TPA: amidohydrolase family protein [Burkholderiaceae bacterium]|jgi:L-fuconolactonase|nr:amidohydrolase family protein [Burkholderiaceae bacterium]
MPRIDAHQHFWRRARGDYAWLREDVATLRPLLRDYQPADLQPLLAAGGVSRTVLVQAADTVAETQYLLDIATQHAIVGGVVGWVDLGRADAAGTLEQLARHPKFKGVRPMLQDLADVDWIASAPRADAVHALVRHGLRFDALVKTAHLPSLLHFVQAWPALPVVIDHAAKPDLVAGWGASWTPPWRRDMSALAAHPQVCCKWSGLVTELPASACGTLKTLVGALRPVWDTLLESFGPRRLLWGSDWPVLTLATTYDTWLEASATLVGELSADEQASVWAGAARGFYGLGD